MEAKVGEQVNYVWGDRRRPHIHPLRTPAGHVLTRNAPDDHPWHHGLWFTIKYVDGDNFWEEFGTYGVLRHDQAPAVTADGDATTIAGEVTWIRPDRETVAVREHRRWTHRPLDASSYALDFETTLVAPEDVVYDRTPFTTWGGYGGLTLRGAGDWHDTRLLLDDGVERERVLGERSAWCALDGVSGDDDSPVGIALLCSSTNPRHPAPWYGSTRADTYGDGWSNFLNAAFLWDEPLSVAGGQPLEFAYRVIIHDGIWDTDRIAEAHDQYGGSRR